VFNYRCSAIAGRSGIEERNTRSIQLEAITFQLLSQLMLVVEVEVVVVKEDKIAADESSPAASPASLALYSPSPSVELVEDVL
jgi:hypothetical protein